MNDKLRNLIVIKISRKRIKFPMNQTTRIKMMDRNCN